MAASHLLAGTPHKLGAIWDGAGVNFALFSAHASAVELCLFTADGRTETARMALPEATDQIWHGYLPGAGPGLVYGYRVHGAWAPQDGHRFNPAKLLRDPYARATIGTLQQVPEIYGHVLGGEAADLQADGRDSAPFVPKCVVVDGRHDWGNDRLPAIPWDRSVFYEAHLRGLTMRHPDVPADQRGRFAGLVAPPVLAHLRGLGVTVIELLPIHDHVDEARLLALGLSNYWGYNSIGFFQPDARFAATPNPAAEFRAMVAGLHRAGFELILDVVYNHTAESDELGPTLSFRGIDNASYYRLREDNRRLYANDAGTGNTLNLAHPRVLQMVMDSLRFWAEDMHVDGFRFDLATVLARLPQGFNAQAGFLLACRQDPVLATRKLIAEPWDAGPDGYHLGRFPPGFAEWNDRYRDTVRDFWRGVPGMAPHLAAALAGSAELFGQDGRRPWASMNFVTVHDGFTLADLVRYNDRHNQANGENGADGTTDNHSSNYGEEGETENPARRALRRRQQCNMLATLLVSAGTPLLLGGDELGRSQGGNNNPYGQDNDIGWIDWTPTEESGALTAMVARLADLRARYGVLRPTRFLRGQPDPQTGRCDAIWLNVAGEPMRIVDWNDPGTRCFGLLRDGGADKADGAVLLIWLNAHDDAVHVTLPPGPVPGLWRNLLDTTAPDAPPDASQPAGAICSMVARSVWIFVLDAVSEDAR